MEPFAQRIILGKRNVQIRGERRQCLRKLERGDFTWGCKIGEEEIWRKVDWVTGKTQLCVELCKKRRFFRRQDGKDEPKMAFTVHAVMPGVWHIVDCMGVCMTLLEGENAAMLVDTGYGIEDVADGVPDAQPP